MKLLIVLASLMSVSAFAADFPIGTFKFNCWRINEMMPRQYSVKISETNISGTSLPVVEISRNPPEAALFRGIAEVEIAQRVQLRLGSISMIFDENGKVTSVSESDGVCN